MVSSASSEYFGIPQILYLDRTHRRLREVYRKNCSTAAARDKSVCQSCDTVWCCFISACELNQLFRTMCNTNMKFNLALSTNGPTIFHQSGLLVFSIWNHKLSMKWRVFSSCYRLSSSFPLHNLYWSFISVRAGISYPYTSLLSVRFRTTISSNRYHTTHWDFSHLLCLSRFPIAHNATHEIMGFLRVLRIPN